MKDILLLISILSVIFISHSQTVSNVSHQIIGDKAYITYDLDKEADVELFVQTNEDRGWNTSFMNWEPYQKEVPGLRAVTGDIGKKVQPGTKKQIIWDYNKETLPFVRRSQNGISSALVMNPENNKQNFINSFKFNVQATEPSYLPELVWIDSFNGVTNEYWIGKYPVTVEEFNEFITETGYKTQAERQGYAEIWNPVKKDWEFKNGVNWKCDEKGIERPFSDYSKYPVVNISWEDANAYCEWLASKTGQPFSLPDYRFWLASCGAVDLKCLGKEGPELSNKPWIQENMGGTKEDIGWFDFNSDYKIHPIGMKKPNKFNIYDMRGNVYEWFLNPLDPGEGFISITEMQVYNETSKTLFMAAGGSAFEPYDSLFESMRTFPKTATGLNIGFRVWRINI